VSATGPSPFWLQRQGSVFDDTLHDEGGAEALEEVFAFQGPKRSLVATGQQTLICVAEGSEHDLLRDLRSQNQPDRPKEK
jgi:hypothetical protein